MYCYPDEHKTPQHRKKTGNKQKQILRYEVTRSVIALFKNNTRSLVMQSPTDDRGLFV